MDTTIIGLEEACVIVTVGPKKVYATIVVSLEKACKIIVVGLEEAYAT